MLCRMEDKLEDYVEWEVDINRINDIKNSNQSDDSFPELWEMEMEALQIENCIDNVDYGDKNEMSTEFEPYLKDYAEPEYITRLEVAKSVIIRENNSFPRLGEIEMEALETKNVESGIENKAISIIEPYLEDYADSENETEQHQEINELNQYEKENSFPPMWELELEILNCNTSSNHDKFNSFNHFSSTVDYIGSQDFTSIESANLQSVEDNTLITPTKEINQTGSMFEKLFISSS